MKKIIGCPLLIFLVVIACTEARAQSNPVANGIVTDDKNAPLEAVTVSLYKATDSSLVKIALTDKSGKYEFVIATGKYYLSYALLGMEACYTRAFDVIPSSVLVFDPVKLQAYTKKIQGVTVTASKPLIQFRADKTVFNVQNSINATGSNALELLQKSPGVIVDNNDNITMKGKAGVKIFIDGRMIQVSGDDLAAYLRSINSNDIESIEMINNPGARYDASGNAGVINIKLRKNTSFGSNGNITAGLIQGVTPKGNASIGFNYRNKKINLFSNAGFALGRNEIDIYAPRSLKDTSYNQKLLIVWYNKSFNAKAGADFFINSKHTIGILATANTSNDNWISTGNTPIYYEPTNTYEKRLDATNAIPRNRTHFNSNINYRFADTSGFEINFDTDYGVFRGRANSYQPNYYYDKANAIISSVITRNLTPTNIDIYTAKLDVITPAFKGQLGFGVKYAQVKTTNQFDFFNEVNGSVTLDLRRSYQFVYAEKVSAAYLSYNRQFGKKGTLQAGLRSEHTSSEGLLNRGDGIVQPDNNVRKKYFDLFPSMVLSWNVNDHNTLSLSAGRRIDRPVYQNLNPFELKLDELTYVKGNSFLRPQYTNSVEFSYSLNNKLTISTGYSHVKDYATQTTDTLNNFTYAYQKNLANQDIANLSISFPVSIKQWWKGIVNVWSNHQHFTGKVVDDYVDLNFIGYGAFTQNTILLGHDYSMELTGFFNGPTATGPTWLARSMGSVDLGIQKLFLDKKLVLKIAATDIFRTTVPYRAVNDFGGLVLRIWVKRETQTARISISYRFGSNSVKAGRKRQTGLEAEAKRIQGD
ncbi:MAG: outer membrane beta-barrel protein [Bacteroidota bacterium]